MVILNGQDVLPIGHRLPYSNIANLYKLNEIHLSFGQQWGLPKKIDLTPDYRFASVITGFNTMFAHVYLNNRGEVPAYLAFI